MTVRRKSPVQHKVKFYKRRDGTKVRPHLRGSGDAPQIKVARVRSIKSKSVSDSPRFVLGTKIPIEWHTFRRRSQQRVLMHPLDFLKLCTPPRFGETKNQPYGFSKHSVKGIDDAIARGETLWSLRLDVDVDSRIVGGHEGRHRAFWAWKQGITKIPVILWHERGNRLTDVEELLDPAELKSEAKHKGAFFDAKDVAIIHEKLTNEERANIYGRKRAR